MGEGGRDRDQAGRPRNARPRDELGPAAAARRFRRAGHARGGRCRPTSRWPRRNGCSTRGRAFHAHEVLEGTWKAAPEAERELWRGLAQLAVGITHVRRGNPAGAVALLGRAADRIEPYGADPPYGIDIAGLVAWARTLAARVESAGLDSLEGSDLNPRLRA